MRVTAHITLTDQTSEETVRAIGLTRDKLRDLYTQAFSNFLEAAIADGAKADILVVVDDNTKEDTDENNQN